MLKAWIKFRDEWLDYILIGLLFIEVWCGATWFA